jgi:broad specificity phosphatase PhoE
MILIDIKKLTTLYIQMEKKKIYIIRHGETDACHHKKQVYMNNEETEINKDEWMNEKGREQIEKILGKIPRTVGKIIASPTFRTMEVAHRIQEHSFFASIITDVRLHNKMENDSIYESNIISLLNDIKEDMEEEIVLVTHGRIVKMIFSIISKGVIDRSIMDIIDLTYGGLTILQYGWFCSMLDG